MTKIDAASTESQDRGIADASTLPTTVTVGEILDRRVPLEWFESVAIIAGLCSSLAESGAMATPAPSDVTLTPEGTVLITGDRDRHHLVALPRLLHELLSVTTPPTPLRLLVLHTISSEGDRSPKTFGAALAYYARPDREAWIKSARQRFLETPAVSAEPGQPKPSEMLDVEPPAPPAPAAVPHTRRKRTVVVAAVAAIVVLATVVVSQKGSRATNVLQNVWHSARAAAAHVADAGRSLAETVTGPSKAEQKTPADAKPSPDAAPATDRPKSRSHRGLQQVAEPLAESQSEATDTRALDAAVEGRVEPLAPAPAPESIAEPTTITHGESDGAQSRTDDDIAIVPPRLLDPIRLPSWARTGDMVSSTGVIELDINESGTVRRVRLVSPATSLTDMMILSAAKTWIFEPAFSGGRAIPYRLSLNWVPPNR
jgi:hypothetical protein